MSLVPGFFHEPLEPDAVLGGHVDVERALAHHVVDDPGGNAQFDTSRREQVVQMPALGRTWPALA